MRLRFTRRSRAHLTDIHSYIAKSRPMAAELVRGRIAETINLLRTVPRLGRTGRRQGTREIGVAGLPYVIEYRIDLSDEDELVILGIYHGARDR